MKKIKLNRENLIKICNKISVPLQVFGCCVLYFFIEAISRHSLMKAWTFMTDRPLVFSDFGPQYGSLFISPTVPGQTDRIFFLASAGDC